MKIKIGIQGPQFATFILRTIEEFLGKNRAHLAKLFTVNPERFLKVNALSKVDFPAPDAPMIAKTSPGLQYPLTANKLTIFNNN